MEIDKVFEIEGKSVKFEGTLDETEVGFLLQVAINYLSSVGAIALQQEAEGEDDMDLYVLGDPDGQSIN